jgi:hypothetical protein
VRVDKISWYSECGIRDGKLNFNTFKSCQLPFIFKQPIIDRNISWKASFHLKYVVLVNRKIISVETIPGMGRGDKGE